MARRRNGLMSTAALSVVALCGALTSHEAMAQEAGASELAGIVVTAQRRAENLQEVPISVAVLNSEQLAQAGVNDVWDLDVAVPNLSIGGAIGSVQPFIRGVGTNTAGAGIENPVAIYVDGVYLVSGPGSALSLSGIERIEVLKGPQGTLFGRNATGGLLSIITKSPGDELEGDVRVRYGNYATASIDGFVSSPIMTNLGGVLAFHYANMGEGYGRNVVRGVDSSILKDDLAVRGKLVGEFGQARVTLAADYYSRQGDLFYVNLPLGPRRNAGFPLPAGLDDYDVNSDEASLAKTKGGGGSLTVEMPVFGDIAFTSITAYRKGSSRFTADFDGTPVPILKLVLGTRDRQFSQEFQLSGGEDGGVRWTTGLFYFENKSGYRPFEVQVFGRPNPHLADVRLTSWAAYGQVTVPLGPNTDVTGGVRYTTEERRLDAYTESIRAAKTFESPTWRLAITHDLSDDLMIYASYDRGFKSGGFNATPPYLPAYDEETVDAGEIGFKSEFGGNIRFNGAAFYMQYTDMQVLRVSSAGTAEVLNAGEAEIYGLELEAVWQATENLVFNAALGVTHARFTDYPNAPFRIPIPATPGASVATTGDATGNRLPMVPDWTANLGVRYTVPLEGSRLEFSGNFYHSDGFFGEADNLRSQDAYNEISASARWTSDNSGLYVGVWGENLSDERVVLQHSGSALSSNEPLKRPRTYGVELGMTF